MHVPITFFLGLFFISRFFNSIDELRRDTFRRLLCLGGGTMPVFRTYVVVVVVVPSVPEDRFELIDEDSRGSSARWFSEADTLVQLSLSASLSILFTGWSTTTESTSNGDKHSLKLGSWGNIHVCGSAPSDESSEPVPPSSPISPRCLSHGDCCVAMKIGPPAAGS